ncbi:MAG: UDP-3-O-(3-hydroxymyristoyl)glucosamine N-acyltransferase [Pseudomonadaceae bacterium]|nr:UDP-3-O-(3-hydroxymyristoyl)glucosamine N-acyltransferase [Pseudomonadaceae bacterium]
MPDVTAGVSLDTIAELINARLVLPAKATQTPLTSLAPIDRAGPSDLTHLSSPAYLAHLDGTHAGAVILAEDNLARCPVAALVCDDPYVGYALASRLFATRSAQAPGIHPSAVVDSSASIAEDASIGAFACIGPDVTIGSGVEIHSHCSIGARCVLAAGVRLHSGVHIYDDVSIGERSVIHSGAVLGADGFGFARSQSGEHIAIEQVGGVSIGADVSVGAGSMIDCGAIDATVVEDGVKIDNLVQIGHNCRIGAHTVLCGTVAIAGSSTIGRYCVLAGGSGVGGDKPVTLCDGVVLTARTVASRSIAKPGFYAGGTLFSDAGRWKRNAIRFDDLDGLARRLSKLEKKHRESPNEAGD